MSIQRLALVATFVLLLWAVGQTLDGWAITDWQLWALGAMFWAAEVIGRLTGRVEGIIDYIDMSEQEQQRLRRALADARRENA